VGESRHDIKSWRIGFFLPLFPSLSRMVQGCLSCMTWVFFLVDLFVFWHLEGGFVYWVLELWGGMAWVGMGWDGGMTWNELEGMGWKAWEGRHGNITHHRRTDFALFLFVGANEWAFCSAPFFLSSSSPVGFVQCIAVVCMGGERGEGVDCIWLYISYSAILPYHLFAGCTLFFFSLRRFPHAIFSL
jgi:hypothetical protein